MAVTAFATTADIAGLGGVAATGALGADVAAALGGAAAAAAPEVLTGLLPAESAATAGAGAVAPEATTGLLPAESVATGGGGIGAATTGLPEGVSGAAGAAAPFVSGATPLAGLTSPLSATALPASPMAAPAGAGAAGAGTAGAGAPAAIAAPPGVPAASPDITQIATDTGTMTGQGLQQATVDQAFASAQPFDMAASPGQILPGTAIPPNTGFNLVGGGGGAETLAASPIETSPGTVGYVDPAYGSFVPPSGAAPSADVFASETAAAPQLAQLSPGGILQPGVGLPDYGTAQFQTAFGDFAPPSIAPTPTQIAAQGGPVLGPEGVPVATAYNPALGALGVSPSAATSQPFFSAASAAQEAGIPPAVPATPEGIAAEAAPPFTAAPQVATSAIGPDPTLANTGDLRVLGATRGATPDALANLPTAPPGAADTGLLGAPGAQSVTGALSPTIAQLDAATPSAVPGVPPAGGGAAGGGGVEGAGPLGPAPASQAPSNAGVPNVADSGIVTGLTPGDTLTYPGGGGGGAASFLSGILKNPSALVAAGGLGLDVLRGSTNPPGYNQILSQAQQTGQQGAQMQKYLASGTLPPGLQTSLNTARADAEATIRSKYASMGMSGSSAEAQDLQNLHNRIVSQGADMALKLWQQGLDATQISSQLYQTIMNEQIAQDQALSQGITNMVTALAGMSRPLVAAGA